MDSHKAEAEERGYDSLTLAYSAARRIDYTLEDCSITRRLHLPINVLANA